MSAELVIQPNVSMNEHKRVMQTYSPKLVAPEFSFSAKLNQALRQDAFDKTRPRQNGSNLFKKKKLTVQVEHNREVLQNQNDFEETTRKQMFDLDKKLVNRKNTQLIGLTSFGIQNT